MPFNAAGWRAAGVDPANRWIRTAPLEECRGLEMHDRSPIRTSSKKADNGASRRKQAAQNVKPGLGPDVQPAAHEMPAVEAGATDDRVSAAGVTLLSHPCAGPSAQARECLPAPREGCTTTLPTPAEALHPPRPTSRWPPCQCVCRETPAALCAWTHTRIDHGDGGRTFASNDSGKPASAWPLCV